MLDLAVTYGGLLFSLAAFGAWLWLALRAVPGLDALIARYEDDLGLGAVPPGRGAGTGFGTLGRLAVSLTAFALLCMAVGEAILD